VVRNERNIPKLEKSSSLVAQSHEQGILEFSVVPDFLEPNAIRNVLNGITSIVHLASPLAAEVHFLFFPDETQSRSHPNLVQSHDYEASIIEPAISMVKVVLDAASESETVRRVVITSSCKYW
jgi:hypothetical protein